MMTLTLGVHMAKPKPFLEIDCVYDLYTKRETLSSVFARCIAILSYQEALKVRFDMGVLGISEKYIPNIDESLESYLKNQNIYYLRGLQEPGTTTAPKEYIVWDDIINRNRTTRINVTHVYDTYISIDDNKTHSPSQITNEIYQLINSKYAGAVHINMLLREMKNADGESTSEEATVTAEDIRQRQLDEAMLYIAEMNKFFNTAIPEIKRLDNLNISTKFANIEAAIEEIKVNINTISANLR